MKTRILPTAPTGYGWLAVAAAALATFALTLHGVGSDAGPSRSWARPPDGVQVRPPVDKDSDGVFVLDGSFVHNVGELQLNITNWGLIGSLPSDRAPYSDSPSAMWPAGSGVEYLYGAGVWVGAIREGRPLVSTGLWDSELLPSNEALDTIYEMAEGEPGGLRYPNGSGDDDGDGRLHEDPVDGRDNDGDGLIDEDYEAIGDQHFRCVMTDTSPVAAQNYPDHDPLGIEVVQESHQWTRNQLKDVILFTYTVKNKGFSTLEGARFGLFIDSDIGPRSGVTGARQDDMVGFISDRNPDGTQLLVETEDKGRAWFNMAYMYDCDGDDGRSPGYIGFMFVSQGNSQILEGQTPSTTRISTFRYYAGTAPFLEGGDPGSDEERYQALTSGGIQEPPQAGDCSKANDYRMLISTSIGTLRPNASVRVQLAIVMGNGIDELKKNAAEMMVSYFGEWFDRDGELFTGYLGRETYICEDDFEGPTYLNPIWMTQIDCIRDRLVTEELLDANRCIWVNSDCGFEELRGAGDNCFSAEFDDLDLVGCTGINGREYSVLWHVRGRPPLKPNARMWETHDRVHVFWDNRSESSRDELHDVPNFESYRVWRADDWDRPPGTSQRTGPATDLWDVVAEYDVVNTFETQRRLPGGGRTAEVLPLGRNTGLEGIQYTPLAKRPGTPQAIRFAPLETLLERIRQEKPELDPSVPVRYRDRFGVITELGQEYPELQDWECCDSQIDTLQAWSRGTRYYEFIDRNVHDGLFYFHSVTATSFNVLRQGGRVVVAGPGQEGSPQNNFSFTVPNTNSQTAEEREQEGANIYVVPNPVTSRSLADFSQLHPNSSDPTGYRVEFRNLPRARNVVRIFTLAGDLVEEIEHDGTGGNGSVSWNLVSRNGQQIVSGIYLYSVVSSDSAFKNFVGRFVVVQ